MTEILPALPIYRFTRQPTNMERAASRARLSLDMEQGAWAWMVAILGMARRWLDRDSAVVRYGRRTGYTVYVVHQPIIVAVAYFVVQTSASVPWKFATIFVISGVATFLSAELLTRLPSPTFAGSRREAT